MLLNCGVGKDSWESLGLQGDQTSQSYRNIHWKDWCWSWNSNTLATWCEELTHWKRLWCWERLRAGGEGDNRGWDVGRHHRLGGHEFEWTPGVVMDREAWHAVVHGVAKSRIRLSNWTELIDASFLTTPIQSIAINILFNAKISWFSGDFDADGL